MTEKTKTDASMKSILGHYVERVQGSGEYLTLGFHPALFPLQERWRNNGLSADFLAGYVSTFFPGEEPDKGDRQVEVKDAVSFIANELLENAMKYSSSISHSIVTIEVFLEIDHVSIYATNSVTDTEIPGFQEHINLLLSGDPSTLYIECLERNAQDETEDGSGLGYLTMLNDYMVTLGWKFETSAGQPTVTTMALLSV